MGERVQNHLIHGYHGPDGLDRGLDWLDGAPVNEDMYDRRRSQVRQYIFVPEMIPGIGSAEQTLSEADVNKTLSFLLYFPRPEFVQMARSINDRGGRHSQHMVLESFGGGGMKGLGMSRGARSLGLDGGGGSAEGMVSEKLAVGGLVRQHIIRNPFGPGFWAPKPEALIAAWPIPEDVYRQMSASRSGSFSGGRRTV